MAIKQIIVIRKDLKMRRGKEITQGAHASMGFLTSQLRPAQNKITVLLTVEEQEWLATGTTKITVQVSSEEELLALQKLAHGKGVKTYLVQDAGRTEFDGVPTYTALAIGPAKEEDLDPITKQLPLY